MKSNIFLTADLHLGHKNIITYSKRPFTTVEEMDKVLIANWNSKVKPGDTIYHVGDFAYGKSNNIEAYIRRLKGKIVFILGSHDRELVRALKKRQWKVHPSLMIKEYGEEIFLAHHAHRVWPKSHYGTIHGFGHSHGCLPDYRLSTDVGVDNNNLFPVNVLDIIERMKPIREQLLKDGLILKGK